MTIQKYNCNFEKLDLKVIEKWKDIPQLLFQIV